MTNESGSCETRADVTPAGRRAKRQRWKEEGKHKTINKSNGGKKGKKK